MKLIPGKIIPLCGCKHELTMGRLVESIYYDQDGMHTIKQNAAFPGLLTFRCGKVSYLATAFTNNYLNKKRNPIGQFLTRTKNKINALIKTDPYI